VTLNSASFDTHQPHIVENIFGPLYSAWHRKEWPSSKGHLTKKTFFLLFSVFFHENKQIPTVLLCLFQYRPTLLYQQVQ
jgi:hypothetical protein